MTQPIRSHHVGTSLDGMLQHERPTFAVVSPNAHVHRPLNAVQVYELGEPEPSYSSALLLAGGPTAEAEGPTAFVQETTDSSSASRTASPGPGGPLKIILYLVGFVFMFVAL